MISVTQGRRGPTTPCSKWIVISRGYSSGDVFAWKTGSRLSIAEIVTARQLQVIVLSSSCARVERRQASGSRDDMVVADDVVIALEARPLVARENARARVMTEVSAGASSAVHSPKEVCFFSSDSIDVIDSIESVIVLDRTKVNIANSCDPSCLAVPRLSARAVEAIPARSIEVSIVGKLERRTTRNRARLTWLVVSPLRTPPRRLTKNGRIVRDVLLGGGIGADRSNVGSSDCFRGVRSGPSGALLGFHRGLARKRSEPIATAQKLKTDATHTNPSISSLESPVRAY